jgi:hypothetical protein
LEGIHPNLRFLGIVGCKSENALRELLTSKNIFVRNPQLHAQGYTRVVDAQKGLKKMLRDSRSVLDSEAVKRGYPMACIRERGFGVRVKRRIPYEANPRSVLIPSIRIETRQRVLGVFDPGWPGALQEKVISVPAPESGTFSLLDLKLMANVGDNYWLDRPDRPLELGEIQFQAPWVGALWELFSNADGTALGTTSRIFRYRGPRDLSTMEGYVVPQEFEPWICQDMPARVP